MRVLLAEDDAKTSRGICLTLKKASIVVDCTNLGQEALEMIPHYDYDAVLISLQLPDMDGTDVVRQLRSAGHKMPVLILAGPTPAQMKVKIFNVGADDFQAKPVDHDEFLARLQAMVRRSKGISDPIFCMGDLQVNFNSREVTVNGSNVHLTVKEFAVFELLVLRRGHVLTKDIFLDHLYGGIDEPMSKIIDIFIHKVRKKLQFSAMRDLITTVWGRGYMLRSENLVAIVPSATVDHVLVM